MSFTPVDQISDVVQKTRNYYDTGVSKKYEWRIAQLKAISRMMSDNLEAWEQALFSDLKQNMFLKTTEIQSSIAEANNAVSNLKEWMKPTQQSNATIMNMPGTALIYPEPFGTVLIISPFNYPISLLTKPLIGAIAAGNCAVLKPSELTPAVSGTFIKLIPKYLDQEAVRIVYGAIPETTELLKQEFDYIFYTGSPQVGKIVMKAASEHLTPVTLELGGKSPCIIDKDASLDVAAKRVTWGKFLNLGQTCIAPDYMFVHKDIKNKFVQKMQENLNEFYGQDPQKSPDYSRIVSERHTERLGALLEGNEKKVLVGGVVDVKDRYVAPTIVDEPDSNSKLMQEEIFGPILPIMSYDNIDDVIKFINQRPKPLALYLFSKNDKLKDKLIEKTSSGAAVINDLVVHNVIDTLPFGGVGNSGMGSYNGHFSFQTFSHGKSVLIKPTWVDPFARYPPYNNTKMSIIAFGLNHSINGLKTIAKYTVPVIIGGLTYLVLSSRL